MLIKTLPVGPLETNCYLAVDEASHQALVIDPGDEAEVILAAIGKAGAAATLIVLTHYHYDHVAATEAVQRATGAGLAIHRLDAALLARPPALFRGMGWGALPGVTVSRELEDGDALTCGAMVLEVRHTPGHTPGGIALYAAADGVLFSGDTLFREGLGRTDFPGGDWDALLASIRGRLLTLPDETTVYPGHGPATTIGHERRRNPWLNA